LSLRDAWASIFAKRDAYRFTFKGPDGLVHRQGQEVLDDLRKFSGVDKPGIVVSPVTRVTDPYATAYRAGQRDVYARILKLLNLEDHADGRTDDNDTTD
jgi:hypothetical protein